jgi:hypothetical protein
MSVLIVAHSMCNKIVCLILVQLFAGMNSIALITLPVEQAEVLIYKISALCLIFVDTSFCLQFMFLIKFAQAGKRTRDIFVFSFVLSHFTVVPQ